jgi:hypothetical protein
MKWRWKYCGSASSADNSWLGSLTNHRLQEIIAACKSNVVADQKEKTGLPGGNRGQPPGGSYSAMRQQNDLRATEGMPENGDADVFYSPKALLRAMR